MSAALVIRGGSTTSNNEERPLYRQHCPRLQAFTALIPTTARAVPLVKEVVTLGASQMFLIFSRTKDFIIEVEREKWMLPCGGQEPVPGTLSFWRLMSHRRSMHVYPCFTREFRAIEIGSGNRQMKNKMSASLLIEHWEKKV